MIDRVDNFLCTFSSEPHHVTSVFRRVHQSRRKWRRKHTVVQKGGKYSELSKYSRRWWLWTHKGRRMWHRCKKAGEGSGFWKKHKCSSRPTIAKSSKWWWWTHAGRKMWHRCQKKGRKSAFWKKHHCGRGRYILLLRFTPLFVSSLALVV